MSRAAELRARAGHQGRPGLMATMSRALSARADFNHKLRNGCNQCLKAARLCGVAAMATWIAGFAGDTSPRRTLIWRVRDRKLLARAETVWVFVDVGSGRGQAIPPDFTGAFETIADERVALQALRSWMPASPTHA
jgi:hypothetical protein